MANRNILYRIFDDDGALLYVGATTNPGLRIGTHAQSQPWWDEAAEIKLERFDTLDELIEEEKAAIQIEGPRYNVIHSAEYPWTAKPRRQKGGGTIFKRADGRWVGGLELPPIDGKRRQRRVIARTRAEVELKLASLKAAAQ